MLIGLDSLLTGDLLWTLASMGHGDDLAIVDANHPAERIARVTNSGRLITCPALPIARVVRAVLSVLPIDHAVIDPIRRMFVADRPEDWPAVQREVQIEVDRVRRPPIPMSGIDRFAFYAAAEKCFAVIQVGDPRPYGCFLVRKGVVAGERPTLA